MSTNHCICFTFRLSAQKVSPFYEEWWFLVVIALVGLIFILLLVFILIIRGQSKKYTKKTDSGGSIGQGKYTRNRSAISLYYADCLSADSMKWTQVQLHFPTAGVFCQTVWEKVIFHLREARGINSGVHLLQLLLVISNDLIADSFCHLSEVVCRLIQSDVAFHLAYRLSSAKKVTIETFNISWVLQKTRRLGH